jgi:putative intracellular protease/amidase
MAQESIHLFVFDTLSDWEFGYAVAGINNPAFQSRPGRYRVRTVAVHGEPVMTAGGLRVLPDLTLDALDPPQSSMLILPGGAVWDQGQNTEAVEQARAFLAAAVPVAAICGATAGLARAGLLDDRRHTSNAAGYLQATGYRGAAFYVESPAVTDGNLITAGGIAPIEFAREIFKRLDLYPAPALEAWYALFKTGDPAHYEALLRSVQTDS